MSADAAAHPQFLCMGLNYRTSPVAVRERVSYTKGRVGQVGQQLAALPGVEECVLLCTCNRTELYFWSRCPQDAEQAVMAYFAGAEPAAETLRACFYLHEGTAALSHLARVAAGLDSMVVGETEIFGQLKDAYAAALAAGTTGALSNRLFQHIFTIGKKVRSSTQITSGPTSVGAVAVQMAQEILHKGLEGSNVLVVGAGEIARSTAKSLRSRGAESIFVANRSYDRAVALAEQVGGRVIRFAEWVPYLENIDIVIVSTASPVYVVSPVVLQRVQQVRQRPLFLIDLSVPRNVDPACAQVAEVHVYDMDTLQERAADTAQHRQAEVAACDALIRAWVAEEGLQLLQPRRIPTAAQPAVPV